VRARRPPAPLLTGRACCERGAIVELPSYFPFGHLVKEMLGVRLRLVLHGVNSHLLAASYENQSTLFDYVAAWRRLEQLSRVAADEIVAASAAEKTSFQKQFKWDRASRRFAASRGCRGDAGRWLYIRAKVAPLFQMIFVKTD
jgi:hypothetical protein